MRVNVSIRRCVLACKSMLHSIWQAISMPEMMRLTISVSMLAEARSELAPADAIRQNTITMNRQVHMGRCNQAARRCGETQKGLGMDRGVSSADDLSQKDLAGPIHL